MVMIARLLSLAAAFSLGAAQAGDEQEVVLAPDTGCPASVPVSCRNTTVQHNLCCFEAPGGLIVQTQFWDTNPSTGPSDSWTIHGLWPDNCDGTFEQNCDGSRQENDIAGILGGAGQTALLSTMDKYWKDIKGDDNDLWSHEWNKHGTCLSTLSRKCVSNTEQAVVFYFNSAVDLFQTLPTFDWLAAAGITPSTTATYSRNEIVDALRASYGFTVGLECQSHTLKQVYYYHNVKGSIQNGRYIRVGAIRPGSCPSQGIKYVPKVENQTVRGRNADL